MIDFKNQESYPNEESSKIMAYNMYTGTYRKHKWVWKDTQMDNKKVFK